MMISRLEEVQEQLHQAINDLSSDKENVKLNALSCINIVGARLLVALKQNNPKAYMWIVDRIHTVLKEQIDDYREINGSKNIILEDAQAGNYPLDADKVFNKEMKAYTEEAAK